MTKLTGILGFPLSHSVSPIFQQAAMDYYGLDVRYMVWDTPPESLGDQIRKLRSRDVLGFNVTVPFKQVVIPYLDEVSPEATVIGAVNTVVIKSDRMIGYNTDQTGFIKALREHGGMDPQGKRALLLGAGGAASAVGYALIQNGASFLVIANRTIERAHRLALELELLSGYSIPAVSLNKEDLSWYLNQEEPIDLLVNCTTLGMSHSSEMHNEPIGRGLIPGSALICDLVYNPLETPLLHSAREVGARTLCGLPMLIYQGASAFRLWTGLEPPVEIMFKAAYSHLE